ncbi:hypothetical protein LINPERPRIM_LOCUS3554 [Linum perenne]
MSCQVCSWLEIWTIVQFSSNLTLDAQSTYYSWMVSRIMHMLRPSTLFETSYDVIGRCRLFMCILANKKTIFIC